MTHDAIRPGDTIDGRFVIEREAGAGGMGVVFRALDTYEGKPVAVKVLRGARSAVARFQREARVLSQLSHPAIVGYVAHGQAGSASYLAMEWLDGIDLSERLTRGPLTLRETVALGRRVADALALAHARGVVHRDLKPSNLFLPARSVADVKLLDFGIARLQGASMVMTAAGVVVGTPGYMAPEQVRGDSIEPAADVFALGCVLFECLTARAAFVGNNMMALLGKILMEEPPRVSEIRAGTPPAVDDVIARMLAKTPKERLRDGGQVRDELSNIEDVHTLADEPTVPSRRSAITRGEQQLVSVVIAAGRAGSRSGPATEVLDEPTSSIEALASIAFAPTQLPETRATAEAPPLDSLGRFGARVDHLADGSVIATLHGAGAATDQAGQAARCALALRSLVPDRPIVLATGRALVAGRLPIGPVIETAASLLRDMGRRAENASSIHLDEVTVGLLPSRFQVRSSASGAELVGEGRGADIARTLLGRATRFVGRDAEMGTLIGLYDQVDADGVARAVIVTGAPGLGKSRLREELLLRLRERDPSPAIWLGAAELLGAGSPLELLARAVRHGLGLGEGGAVDRDTLIARVARSVEAPDANRVATFIGELVGAPLDAPPAVAHADAPLKAARREPPLMAEQMRRAFVDLLRAECTARPLILVLEDAHWGDQPSMKLVDAALRELAESPLLVVAFARPEVEDACPALWAERSVLRISLAALAPRAAERFARDVLGPDTDAGALKALIAQAAGNPFFLEELLRAHAAGAGSGLPGTLLAVIHKRLERFDEDSRRVLRGASVYGGVFWRGSVASLLGGAGELDIDRALQDLVEREVVIRQVESRFDGETEYTFRHALVRDAAYQMLPDGDRMIAHQFAGEWLDAVGEPNQAILAEHFERGGDKERASARYAVAAAQALKADDLDRCLLFSKRGLDLASDDSSARGALHLARAEAYQWRAQYDQALVESLDAIHLVAPGSNESFAALGVGVAAAAVVGRTEEALELASRIIRPGAAQDQPAFLLAAARCVAYLPTGPTTDAMLAMLPAETASLPDALVAARIEVARGVRAHGQGRPADALEHFSRAAEHFERAGHARGRRSARQNVGYVCTELGRHEEAESLLRSVLAEDEAAGSMLNVAWAKMHLGIVLGLLGRTDEALAFESDALDLAKKQGNLKLEGEIAVAMADIYNAAGAPERAEEQARRALELTDTGLRVAALSARAQARLALGDALGGYQSAAAAIELVQADDAGIVARLVYAQSLHALDRRSEAVAALATAKDVLLARAESISDPAERQTYLERVPANARVLHLAAKWSNPGA